MVNVLYLHETSMLAGAENSLWNLVNKIDKEQFHPVFICPCEGPFVDKLRQLGIKIYFVKFPPVREILGIPRATAEIRGITRKEKIHILHSNSIRTHIYASIAGKLDKIPVIWHQRNMLTGEKIDPDRLFSFLPDRIICNSCAIGKRFLVKDKLPDKVRIVLNGVDLEKFNPFLNAVEIKKEFGILPGEIVIGIASRFNVFKGHDTFFKAAQMLIYNTPYKLKNLKFLIAGGAVFEEDKKREKDLRKMVHELGINDRVVFTGFRRDMPEIYAAMDILVLPSVYEGCSRIILESMACGKPVVATNSGGTPEILKDGISGFLIKPENSEALAEKIAVMVHDIAAAKKMGETGRKIAEENFSIEKNVEQIEKIYLELIQK
ncbi:MAG: glycosyltransferase family 4 protein [bacterium]